MYDILYTKTALNDLPKLKAAHLENKLKALLEVIKENPYQTPPIRMILLDTILLLAVL